MITPEEIRQLLEYEPLTGAFSWKVRLATSEVSEREVKRWNTRHAGKPALTAVTRDGYLHGHIKGRVYLAHRVAFAHAYGRWPSEVLDHKNGDGTDNRIENLREATPHQNASNRVSCGNRWGYKGVIYHSTKGKWMARVQSSGKRHYFGYHDSPEGAAIAARIGREKLHGQFARHAIAEATP